MERLIEKLKDTFDSVYLQLVDRLSQKKLYHLGTFVRSKRLDRLGIMADAFYGELDKDNKKIIIYTILLFPKKNMLKPNQKKDIIYLTNEYEYEVIGYLMIKPNRCKKIILRLGRRNFFMKIKNLQLCCLTWTEL